MGVAARARIPPATSRQSAVRDRMPRFSIRVMEGRLLLRLWREAGPHRTAPRRAGRRGALSNPSSTNDPPHTNPRGRHWQRPAEVLGLLVSSISAKYVT